MMIRKPLFIGLLVAVAILASSWLRPAAACGSRCKFGNADTCTYTITNVDCLLEVTSCYDQECPLAPVRSAGLSAKGTFSSSASDQLCSLPPGSASAASTEAVRGPIKAVILKART